MGTIKHTLSRSFGRIRAVERVKLLLGTPAPSDEEQLLMEMSALREKIENCRARFDLIADDDLTEACIFELSALQAQYKYLLKRAKAAHLRCAFVRQIELERTG